MAKVLLTIISLSAIIAIPTQSIVLGLNSGRSYFRELFKHKSILIRYIITMFIIMPLLAVVFYNIFGRFSGLWIGILMISVLPASPGMTKNISKLGGDRNVSLAWMIITIILSLIFLPLNLYILQNFLKINIDLGIDDVFIKVLIMFLAPIGIGFLISKYLNQYVPALKKILGLISKIAMMVLVICLLILAGPLVISKDPAAILLILAYMITALVIAHFMSSPEKTFGPVLPYSVILRLPAPAIILTQINRTTEKHLWVIITYTIFGTVLMMIYNKLLLDKNK